MQASVSIRSYLAAGVAVAGAAAIAVTPVQPMVAAQSIQHVANSAIALTAAPSPIDVYSAVFASTVQNVTNLGTLIFAAPPVSVIPVIANAFTNVVISAQILAEAAVGTVSSIGSALVNESLPAISAAFQDLISLNIGGAINNTIAAILAPLRPLLLLGAPITEALTNPIYNIANVIKALGTPEQFSNIVLGFAGPIISTIGATGAAIQNVINSVTDGDFAGALSWLVSAPAVIADGLLNGGYGPAVALLPGPTLEISGGLLNVGVPTSFFPVGGQVYANGLVASLLELRATVAGSLCPSGPCTNPSPTASVPATVATRSAAAVAAPEVEAPAVEAPAAEAPAVEAPAPAVETPAVADSSSARSKARASREAVSRSAAPAAVASTESAAASAPSDSASTGKAHRGASRKAAASSSAE